VIRLDKRLTRTLGLPFLAIAAFLAACRGAFAYIDPGTGSAIFGWLAPILGVIGVVLVATFRYSWALVKLASGFIWRHRRWTLPLAAGAVVAIAVILFARGARTQSHSPRVPHITVNQTSHDSENSPRTIRRRQVHMGRVMDLYEAGHAGRLRPAEPFRLFGLDEYPDLRRHKYELDCESRSCFIFDVSGSIRKTVTPRSGSRLVFDVAADFPQNGHANDSEHGGGYSPTLTCRTAPAGSSLCGSTFPCIRTGTIPEAGYACLETRDWTLRNRRSDRT